MPIRLKCIIAHPNSNELLVMNNNSNKPNSSNGYPVLYISSNQSTKCMESTGAAATI